MATLSHSSMRTASLPMKAFDIRWIDTDALGPCTPPQGAIEEILILEYNCSPGASVPSVLISERGRKARASVEMYFPTAADAQAEIDAAVSTFKATDPLYLRRGLESGLQELLQWLDQAHPGAGTLPAVAGARSALEASQQAWSNL